MFQCYSAFVVIQIHSVMSAFKNTQSKPKKGTKSFGVQHLNQTYTNTYRSKKRSRRLRGLPSRRNGLSIQPINRNLNPWNSLWLTSETIASDDTNIRWDVSDLVALYNRQMTPKSADKIKRTVPMLAIRFRLHEVNLWVSVSAGAANSGAELAFTAFSLVDPTTEAATETRSPKALKTIEAVGMGSADFRPCRIRYRWPRFHRTMVFEGDIDPKEPDKDKDFTLFRTRTKNVTAGSGTMQCQVTTQILISWCQIDIQEFPDAVSAKTTFDTPSGVFECTPFEHLSLDSST